MTPTLVTVKFNVAARPERSVGVESVAVTLARGGSSIRIESVRVSVTGAPAAFV